MGALLFFIIFLEGYVVLAAELIAIRQMTPVAGTGTDVIAIIIAAVLMPLAFGYDAGGRYSPPPHKDYDTAVRMRLARNFLTASAFFCIGLSEPAIKTFFSFMQTAIPNISTLIYVVIYSALFLVIPVYLLAQTIPLVLKLIKNQDTSRITGRVLLFSTLGSFMGSVFTTVVLMMTIGVYNTVIVVLGAMTVLTWIILPNKKRVLNFAAMIPLLVCVLLNSPIIKQRNNIVSDNTYNTIRIFEHPDDSSTTVMALDDAYSAALREGYPVFPYAVFIEDTFIAPIENNTNIEPKDILVIGSGGFTMGLYDTHNTYSYVDIDPALKWVSEELFIKKELEDNKTFYPLPARRFISELKNTQKFDLIIVDVFRGKTLPEPLTTQEFFTSLKNIMKPNARLAMNLMICPNMSDQFSLNIDATVRSVFPNINYFLIGASAFNYDGWKTYERENGFNCAVNGLYTYFNTPEKPAIYTDNKNTAALDY